jgi:hypothetical protein
MTEVPAVTPLTTPPDVIVATAVLLLLHVPPLVVLLNTVVDAWHTESSPVIPAGAGLTITVVIVWQPVGNP